MGSRRWGREVGALPSYGGLVTPATAAARARLAFAALVVALGGFAGTSSADGAGSAWSSYLAPAGACQGADDARASVAVQREAITCLVNWARRLDNQPLLLTPPKLERASAIKGRYVVSCGQLSHTPCGSNPTAAIEAAGYRYGWFGENLWYGTWGQYAPRQVVEGWLQSAGHRANLLRPGFRHFGASRVRAQNVFGEARTAVWVATFASPR